jgi:hypothetical protein
MGVGEKEEGKTKTEHWDYLNLKQYSTLQRGKIDEVKFFVDFVNNYITCSIG